MNEQLKLRCIDGATGSELERRGVDLSLPLWSSRALLDAPEVVAEVHRDYLSAGAEAITPPPSAPIVDRWRRLDWANAPQN